LGGVDRVGHSLQDQREQVRIVDRVGGAWVAVAWLTDGSGIDGVTDTGSQNDRRVVIALWHEAAEVISLSLKDHRQMRVAKQTELAFPRLQRPQGIVDIEDVVILVEG
jgi:hypothetical protein